jgi:hypothetical protein
MSQQVIFLLAILIFCFSSLPPIKKFQFTNMEVFNKFQFLSTNKLCRSVLSNKKQDRKQKYNMLYINNGHFCHFFSQNLYLIRLSKTTYPIEFSDSSNWAKIFRENQFKRKWSESDYCFEFYNINELFNNFSYLRKNLKMLRFGPILLLTRYLCLVWAIKEVHRISHFQKPNYRKKMAKKVAKMAYWCIK